jgi:hypothetical protein
MGLNLRFAGCYFEAAGFQSLSVEYFLGKDKEESKRQITKSSLPDERKQKLIQTTETVYQDRPQDYEEYGAKKFLQCGEKHGLKSSADLVGKCFVDSWVVDSAIIARQSKIPVEQVIQHHQKCQAFGCKNKQLNIKEIIGEVYSTSEPLESFAASRFRRCVTKE